MREILHKAKRKDNGEWVEGWLWKKKYNTNKIFISYFPDKDDNEEVYVIDENTFCQFTGLLTCKNGQKIWENDIVEFTWRSGRVERYLIWWCREMNMMTAISLNGIEFNGHDYWGGEPMIDYSTFCLMMQDPWGDIKEVKVVGNIFDNPELVNR